MKKGTKGIRKVYTGANEYYVYDLDEDAFGKRKRFYGKSESEFKQKIELANKERLAILSVHKPLTCKLGDYVRFYFKNAIGNIPSRDIKRLLTLFESAVFNTSIYVLMDTITVEQLNIFYRELSEKFSVDSLKEINMVLQKTFDLTNNKGFTSFDFSLVKIPEETQNLRTNSYILIPQEYDVMLSFCLKDNCNRYVKNELVIVFAMYTGLKISSVKALTVADVNVINALIRNGRE